MCNIYSSSCIGTLGDIQPLLLLAKFLLDQSSEATEANIEIFFVTQIYHESTVRSIFPVDASASNYNKKFSVSYVHSHPIGLNYSDSGKNKGEDSSENDKFGRDSFYSLEELDLICIKIASIATLRLVIANLFCLVGFLVAEKKGIRCLFLHPHKPSSRKPANYQSVLKRGAPTFYQQLFQKESRFATNYERDLSNWQDYDEWLWPLLSPMYDSTRAALHLPHFTSTHYKLPLAPVVLLSVSPQYYPPPGYWPRDKYIVIGYIRYKIDKGMIGQGYDDNNDNHSDDCDDIKNDPRIQTNPNQHLTSHESPLDAENDILPENIQQFISRHNNHTICVDFGSMTEVIVHEHSLELFCCTLLRIKNFSFIILCHGYATLIQTCLSKAMKFLELTQEVVGDGNLRVQSGCEDDRDGIFFGFSGNICLVNEFIDHWILFKKCVGILHHGGAGIVNCCLLVGIPQGKNRSI